MRPDPSALFYTIVAISFLLALVAAGMNVWNQIRPRTPCKIGSTKLTHLEGRINRFEKTQQEKNHEFDARLLRGTRAMQAINKTIADGLEHTTDKIMAEVKEMRTELKQDIVRMEERSNKEDDGLKKLSTDLTNAVGTIRDLLTEERRKG